MMRIATFLMVVALTSLALGHNHGHGEGAEHFHEDEHLEDHRHWYTKEANEKLQEALKDDKKVGTKRSRDGTEGGAGFEQQGNQDDGGHAHEEERKSASHAHHSHGKSHENSEHGHSHHGHDHHGHGHHGHGHHGHGHHGHSHHGHSDHGHGHHGHATQEDSKATARSANSPKMQPMRYVWLESILSTCLISAAPFFILFFVPLESNSEEQRPLLKVLLSFASGGLLGDAFLHLIPHAISPHSHHAEPGHSHSHSHSHVHEGESPEHSHDHSADMIVGLWVLAGMVAFLIVEKFVRHVKGGHSHSHGHSHVSSKDDDDAKVVKSDRKTDESNELKERKKEAESSGKDKTEEGMSIHFQQEILDF